MSAEPRQLGPPDVGTPASTIPMGLRILAMVLRALFIGALVAVTARISSPQSESIWTVYETSRRSDQACSGIRGVSVDGDPSFHASRGRRGISDLALPRPCRRPARIGGRHRHLVRCARNNARLLWIQGARSGRRGDRMSGRMTVVSAVMARLCLLSGANLKTLARSEPYRFDPNSDIRHLQFYQGPGPPPVDVP